MVSPGWSAALLFDVDTLNTTAEGVNILGGEICTMLRDKTIIKVCLCSCVLCLLFPAMTSGSCDMRTSSLIWRREQPSKQCLRFNIYSVSRLICSESAGREFVDLLLHLRLQPPAKM